MLTNGNKCCDNELREIIQMIVGTSVLQTISRDVYIAMSYGNINYYVYDKHIVYNFATDNNCFSAWCKLRADQCQQPPSRVALRYHHICRYSKHQSKQSTRLVYVITSVYYTHLMQTSCFSHISIRMPSPLSFCSTSNTRVCRSRRKLQVLCSVRLWFYILKWTSVAIFV